MYCEDKMEAKAAKPGTLRSLGNNKFIIIIINDKLLLLPRLLKVQVHHETLSGLAKLWLMESFVYYIGNYMHEYAITYTYFYILYHTII